MHSDVATGYDRRRWLKSTSGSLPTAASGPTSWTPWKRTWTGTSNRPGTMEVRDNDDSHARWRGPQSGERLRAALRAIFLLPGGQGLGGIDRVGLPRRMAGAR